MKTYVDEEPLKLIVVDDCLSDVGLIERHAKSGCYFCPRGIFPGHEHIRRD